MQEQVAQQRELLGRQVELRRSAPYLEPGGVELDVAVADHRSRVDRVPPLQGADAGGQLA